MKNFGKLFTIALLGLLTFSTVACTKKSKKNIDTESESAKKEQNDSNSKILIQKKIDELMSQNWQEMNQEQKRNFYDDYEQFIINELRKGNKSFQDEFVENFLNLNLSLEGDFNPLNSESNGELSYAIIIPRDARPECSSQLTEEDWEQKKDNLLYIRHGKDIFCVRKQRNNKNDDFLTHIYIVKPDILKKVESFDELLED